MAKQNTARKAQPVAVVKAEVAPVAKAAAHLAASRKTGLQLTAESKLALTAYGLKAANPWGKGKGGEPIYGALLKAGKGGMTLGALEAMCGKGGTIKLTTKASVRDHVRYLWCWGHGDAAYLAVDGKVCPTFEYGVRPAH